MLRRLAVFCVVSGLGAVSVGAATRDLDALLDGVREIDAPGVPGSLCTIGRRAFAVVVGASGRDDVRAPVAAAAVFGSGRVAAFGHSGYLGAGALAKADTTRLLLNAARWASGKQSPHVAVRRAKGAEALLRKNGMPVRQLDSSNLAGVDLVVANAHSLSGADVKALTRFVSRGGGLILAATGWGWLQLNRGKSLEADFAGNRLLGPMGLVWTDGTLKRTCGQGYAVANPPAGVMHPHDALDLAVRAEQGGGRLAKDAARQASESLTRLARYAPWDDRAVMPRLRRLLLERGDALTPTPARPITSEQLLDRMLVALQVRELGRLDPRRTRAHPAAEAFPGPVARGAPRVSRTVAIDPSTPGWCSTGLYAPPGGLITVEAPASAAVSRLRVRIGAHRDRLWHHAKWKRVPEITRSFPLKAGLTHAASAFGGLVYIERGKRAKGSPVELRIRGAVEAPYYVLGETSAEAWRTAIRNRPAPWGELATSKVILTAPTSQLRALDDPAAVLEVWDRVLDACADLATIPRERKRPERIVPDVQISAGYMHSGYPIMTHADQYKILVDRAAILKGRWGLFHELGHNHQNRDWTFGGTTEVTVNLFTLYVYDTVCGVKTSEGRMAAARTRKPVEAYFAKGRPFDLWKRKPFLALVMYVQLQQAFGWDAFKRVFAEYRRLPKAERPKTDADKRDQWLVRFSRAVGRNLGPFFEAWNVPTSEAARASIAGLPVWMPEGFPPAAASR